MIQYLFDIVEGYLVQRFHKNVPHLSAIYQTSTLAVEYPEIYFHLQRFFSALRGNKLISLTASGTILVESNNNLSLIIGLIA